MTCDASRRSRAAERGAGIGARWTAGLLLLAALAAGCDSPAQTLARSTHAGARPGVWISREEVLELPMSGPAWEGVVAFAKLPATRPDLSNQDDPTNVRVLAKALYFARTGETRYADDVLRALERVRGTERGASALAIARELMAYVVAADLVGLDAPSRSEFERWLRRMASRSFSGRTLRSTHEDRPNNWGTHAGATRIAIAVFLGDTREIERAAHVFHGWAGEPRGWQGFEFEAPWWQPEGLRRFAVNPRGALREGHPIGGVLPDDQRRGGRFRWPPPKENYVYEALQGAVAQAVLLDRQGYDAWTWGDRAILRAFDWLHREADFPARGDDTWMPPIVNDAYGLVGDAPGPYGARRFPSPVPSRPGKAMGFGDWTHAPSPSTPRPAASRAAD